MSREPAAEQKWTGGEVIEIRRTVAGRTASYAVRVQRGWMPGDGSGQFNVAGELVASGFSAATDSMLDRQRDSINRLLEHVKHHCPAFSDSPTSCPHNTTQRKD